MPFCLFVTTSDASSLRNNGGSLPFRFLARNMTGSRFLRRKRDRHRIVMLRMSPALNSQSSQVSVPSSRSPKIRLFLRLWFSSLCICDSSLLTWACSCLWPNWLKILVVHEQGVNVFEDCFIFVILFWQLGVQCIFPGVYGSSQRCTRWVKSFSIQLV